MVLLMVLTVGYMPVFLRLLLEGVSVDPITIARSPILLMLLPPGAGLLVKTRYGNVADRIRTPLNRINRRSHRASIGT
jgi:BASS family bile acid:Na+ symporter